MSLPGDGLTRSPLHNLLPKDEGSNGSPIESQLSKRKTDSILASLAANEGSSINAKLIAFRMQKSLRQADDTKPYVIRGSFKEKPKSPLTKKIKDKVLLTLV